MSTSGDLVVCLHGNPGSGHHWGDIASAAASALGGAHTLCPTFPGFAGQPLPPGFEPGVPHYTQFLADLIADNPGDRVHLVMHDFGGAFGLAWALMNPERVGSLTLINTGVLAEYRWHRLARIWRTPVVGELFNALTTRAAFSRTIDRGQPTRLPAPFIRQMWRENLPSTRKTVLSLYRNTPEELLGTLTGAFRELDPPTLVLWGAHDPYLPVAYAERQRETFPSARVRVLEDCGHWPYADNPDLVQHEIATFLSEVRRDDQARHHVRS